MQDQEHERDWTIYRARREAEHERQRQRRARQDRRALLEAISWVGFGIVAIVLLILMGTILR
jgi:hypothetical protein